MSFGLVIVVIPTAMNNELLLLSDKCLWNIISYGEEALEIRIDYRTQWDIISKIFTFRHCRLISLLLVILEYSILLD